MSGMIDNTPTLEGFIAWVRTAMDIPDTVLPDNSQFFVWSFNVAKATVSTQMCEVFPPPIYMLAVYNLGGDNLVNWAQDNPNLPPPNNKYFTNLRKSLGLSNFVPGVISSSSDEGSSNSYEVIEGLKQLTLGQLQNLKTPWGRQYLAWAQSLGSLWGIS